MLGQLLAIALGQNTSIQKHSIRHVILKRDSKVLIVLFVEAEFWCNIVSRVGTFVLNDRGEIIDL